MNKEKIQGWQNVFSFTFVQAWKSKTVWVTTLILCLVALFALPIYSFMNGTGKKDSFSIHKNYISVQLDEISKDIKEEKLQEDLIEEMTEISKDYAGIEVVSLSKEEVANIKDKLKNADEKEKSVLTEIKWKEGAFLAEVTYGGNSAVKSTQVTDFAGDLGDALQSVIPHALNMTKEQRQLMEKGVQTEIHFQEENKEEKDSNKGMDLSESEYTLMLAVIVVSVFILSFTGESVATSIVTEKSSRVVEYLLTSIQPMAIIIGKVLASTATILVQMLCIGSCAGLSVFIHGLTSGTSSVKTIETVIKSPVMRQISVPNVLIALFIILLAVLIFGFLAGIAGAAVSKVEETGEGLKVYNILLIIGAYFAMFVVMSGTFGNGSQITKEIGIYVPFTSIFILPGLLILGKASYIQAGISILLLVITLVLLVKFVSVVYEGMIYYRGNTMKWKDIVQLFKDNYKEGPSNEE